MIETDVSARIRIEAAHRGVILWRNNSGAFESKDGRWVRFGLCNESAAVNAILKSSDLVGVATGWWWGFPAISGVWVAIEAKKNGWRYSGKGREPAQKNYIELVKKYGGCACFATGWEDVERELAEYFRLRCGWSGVLPGEGNDTGCHRRVA